LPRSIFFLRVMQAWNDLKTPERRVAYDAGLAVQTSPISRANRNSQDAKEVKRKGLDRSARGGRLCRKEQATQMTGQGRKARSKGLWRLIMFGQGWRVP
jgi:hypothetical protein